MTTTSDFLNETRKEESSRAQAPDNGGHTPLFNENELNDLRGRWQRIQGSFGRAAHSRSAG
jgi:hypothetical protein